MGFGLEVVLVISVVHGERRLMVLGLAGVLMLLDVCVCMRRMG